MRSTTILVTTMALALGACGSPNDVLVKRSDSGGAEAGAESTTTATTTATTTTTNDAGSTSIELDPLDLPVDERPALDPMPANTAVEVPETSRPANSAPQDPPIVTATTFPDDEPGVFPPSGDDWTDHPLASLAPHPEDLGPGWVFDYGNLNAAEAADPDDAIPNCDAPVPPMLDGFDVEYRLPSNDDVERELELTLGQGSPADAQLWVDAIRGIAGCDLGEEGFRAAFELTEHRIAGADDGVIVTSASDIAGYELSFAIAVASLDGLSIAAFAAVDGVTVTGDDLAVDLAAIVAEILANR